MLSATPRRLVAAFAALAMSAVSFPAMAQQRADIVVGVADTPPTLEPAKELSNVGTRVR